MPRTNFMVCPTIILKRRVAAREAWAPIVEFQEVAQPFPTGRILFTDFFAFEGESALVSAQDLELQIPAGTYSISSCALGRRSTNVRCVAKEMAIQLAASSVSIWRKAAFFRYSSTIEPTKSGAAQPLGNTLIVWSDLHLWSRNMATPSTS